MSTLIIAVLCAAVYLLAYFTYGRWLGRKLFQLDRNAVVPSRALRDDNDFVPTPRAVVFGHHFTSIAGTGPIVGPAIAVFWGWLPALLWILLGSIFIGAMHDLGSLVISLRNRGQTVGEIAGRVISPRTRFLFLTILFFALLIVLAIFGLVIAQIFSMYPGSVLGVWLSLPLAMIVGYLTYRRGMGLLGLSLVSLVLLYAAVYVGVYYLPIRLPTQWNSVMVWTVILLVYCFFASTWPVWLLLQPRDYLNSHQLVVSLVLLFLGLIVAGWQGASLFSTTPAVVATEQLPSGAPSMFPFLFITIACGACSGFHCLVSSGTTSKQISNECDAQAVGYGSMLLEGMLAVVVVLACCAGVGMGRVNKTESAQGQIRYERAIDQETQQAVTGEQAWRSYYSPNDKWVNFKLQNMVGAFVDGGANFLTAIGIPLTLGVGLISVLVACFAATTLDSAARLQRYVVQELAGTIGVKPLTDKYAATLFAIVLSGLIAAIPGAKTAAGDPIYGSGGLILWPLFGAINQLLAGLALMVIAAWLYRRNKPVWFVMVPLVFMVIMPAWAILINLFSPDPDIGWIASGNRLLTVVAMITLGLQVWIAIEFLWMWPKIRGVLEKPAEG
jgi:carbon starvation protein